MTVETVETDKGPRTFEEVHKGIARLEDWIKSGMMIRRVAVIEDYPIGRSERGRCKLEVEHNKNGWRTVRTTTDKHGRWCKPKMSTYQEGPIVVVSHPTLDRTGREYAWLRFGRVVGLIYANGEHHILAAAPDLYDQTIPREVRELHHMEVGRVRYTLLPQILNLYRADG